MTIQEAANLLLAHLCGKPWVTAVGVGEEKGTESIFIYVMSLKQADVAFLREGWHGFPVVVRKMGPPGPFSGKRKSSTHN